MAKKEEKKKRGDIFIELAKAKGEEGVVSKMRAEGDESLAFESEGQLTVDVYRDGDDLVVESAVAGVDPDDLEINITSDSVSIRGKRERERTVEEKDYFYQECFWGQFSRSVILPEEVDPDKSKAVLGKNGVLMIRMPKIKKKKPKKVEVSEE